jgi:CBS domain-containing protein
VVRGLAEGAGPDSPVGPLASAKLVGVDAEAGLGSAGQLMRDNAVRRLPVIDSGQIVGIVSLGDLAVSTESETPLAAVSKARANT